MSRLRYQLRQKSGGRPRLSVFRSGKHIYAQVIDDAQGRTLAAASSIEKELRDSLKTGADKDAAAVVGKLRGRAGAGRRGRPRSCSTAGPTCIMAGSRPWPTPPARAGCRSEDPINGTYPS